jgi:hypothetical protein
VSTYVRTRHTFHRRDCPHLKRAHEVQDWDFLDKHPHRDPVSWGRAVLGLGFTQPCLRCFPEVAS